MTTGGESLWDVVAKFINFAILVAVLVKLGAKPLREFLVGRSNAVKGKMDEANRILAEAQTLKEDFETKLSRLDQDMEAFRNTVMSEAEQERARIVEEANQFTAKIKEQARLTYEQELRETRNKIREEVVQLTMEKAEKLVAERIGKPDHDRMVDDFIAKLRSMN